MTSRKALIQSLLQAAKADGELTVRAHRYALRQFGIYKRANGDVTDLEFRLGYEAAVSRYVNNLANW
jgi:hypothetical protein